MRPISSCVHAKWVHRREIHIFPLFLDTCTNHEASQESPRVVEPEGFWGHSRFTLGSFGDFGMTFRTIWVYEGYFDIILVDFQEILIFRMDFNGFI